MEPTRCSLIPNDVLEGAKEIKELGQGVTGAVYLIETREGSFALKKLEIARPGFTLGYSTSRLIELDSLVRLRHEPEVIQVKGICVNPFGLNILMEALDGNLEDFIRLTPVYQRVQMIDSLVQPMLRVLALFEQSNIYHYDIKPMNILFKQTDTGVVFKVSDFGLVTLKLSRAADRDAFTLPYRPPEYLVERDQTTFDRNRGDVWAMGLTFLEFLIGHRVFYGKNEKMMLEEIHRVMRDKLTPKEFRKQVKADSYGDLESFVPAKRILKRQLYPGDYDELNKSLFDIFEGMLYISPSLRAVASDLLDDYYGEEPPELQLPPEFPRRITDRGLNIIFGLVEENLVPTLIAVEIYTRFLGTLSEADMYKMDRDEYPLMAVHLALKYLDEDFTTRGLFQRYDDAVDDPQFEYPDSWELRSRFIINLETEILVALDFLIYNLRLTPFTEPEYLEKMLELPLETYLRPIETWFN